MDTRNEQTAQRPDDTLAAGFFQAARTTLDEGARQAERWMEHGEAQIAEGMRVARALRGETEAALGAFVDGSEQLFAHTHELGARVLAALSQSAAVRDPRPASARSGS
jgi:hypothetical protein